MILVVAFGSLILRFEVFFVCVGVRVCSFVWEYPVIQAPSLFFCLFVLIFIGVYLLYNVLVSAVQ